MRDLREFIGCPFRNHGRGETDPDTRRPVYDCYGLFMAIYRDCYGILVPDYTISCFATEEIRAQFEREVGKWEELQEPEAPCAVALAANPHLPGMVCHFGIYVGYGKFIHTLKKSGSIVSYVYDPVWKNKIKGYYRWKRSS